jgi:predicted small metal-binding protein
VSVRTIECNVCGEAVTAADDEELTRNLVDHLKDEHDETPSDDDVHQTVDREAYDAMDS